jgi:hypothetical protein
MVRVTIALYAGDELHYFRRTGAECDHVIIIVKVANRS